MYTRIESSFRVFHLAVTTIQAESFILKSALGCEADALTSRETHISTSGDPK